MFTASILALEPVSLPIAALMVPLTQVALGLAEARVAFEAFSRPVVFLILSSLFLAEALRKHGLTRRLALATIVASGGGVPAVLFGLMAIAALILSTSGLRLSSSFSRGTTMLSSSITSRLTRPV